MDKPHTARQAVRFGVFEVDPRAGELRKNGLKVRLQEQPFQVLAMLLEHPGELVSREGLQQRLWSNDTFVDFENSLNKAVKKLREALCDSAENPRFIETLPRRGYRFLSPVEAVPLGKQPLERFSTAIKAIAVLPLENISPDPEQEYFADGMTEALITSLSKIASLRVISRTSVMQFKGVHRPVPEIARMLNVGALVEGSVLRWQDRVRITAHLIDALTDQHLWSETYERDLRDVLWLQNEVAAGIAREIRVTLTPQDQARLSSAPSLHPETQEFYLKGRYYWHKWTEKGWRKSCDYFEQAIRKDPGYALAYAGLAQTQCQLGLRGVSPPNETWPKAKRAAQKALEIDHLLADARTALGVVNAYYDWNWQAAEESFKSAIDISPSFAFGHRVYAIYLAMQGRFDKAIEEVQRSQQHDPLSLHIILTAGFVFYFARRYDEAIEQYQRILEMDPYFAAAHWLLGECYLQKGRCEIAIEECEKALALSEDRDGKAALGHAYGLIGKREEATKIANQLESEFERTYVHPGSIALVYTGLGDTERALQWLETAYQWRSHSVLFAMIDPRYDSLRSDRRFTALMQRLGLPPSFKSCGRRTLL